MFSCGSHLAKWIEYQNSCDLINVYRLVFNSETVVCGSYSGSVLRRRNANCVLRRCELVLMEDEATGSTGGMSTPPAGKQISREEDVMHLTGSTNAVTESLDSRS